MTWTTLSISVLIPYLFSHHRSLISLPSPLSHLFHGLVPSISTDAFYLITWRNHSSDLTRSLALTLSLDQYSVRRPTNLTHLFFTSFSSLSLSDSILNWENGILKIDTRRPCQLVAEFDFTSNYFILKYFIYSVQFYF